MQESFCLCSIFVHAHLKHGHSFTVLQSPTPSIFASSTTSTSILSAVFIHAKLHCNNISISANCNTDHCGHKQHGMFFLIISFNSRSTSTFCSLCRSFAPSCQLGWSEPASIAKNCHGSISGTHRLRVRNGCYCHVTLHSIFPE